MNKIRINFFSEELGIMKWAHEIVHTDRVKAAKLVKIRNRMFTRHLKWSKGWLRGLFD